MFHKKAVSGVITTGLLLLFSIAAFVVLQNWFYEYKSDLNVKIEIKDFKGNVEILKIDQTTLYLKNDYKNDLLIKSIKIGSRVCEVNDIIVDKGIVQIDIGACTYNLEGTNLNDVRIVTTDGVLSEYEMIESPLDRLFVVSEQFAECNFASGYIRLFGLTDIDNAHVDIDGTSTFNICVRHFNYTLGTVSSGNFVNLLYVTEQNNSAVWIEKDSILIPSAQWYNISLSSSGGAISYVINSSDMIADGYSCIARIDRDDVYGSHAGTCDSSLPDALWFKIG